MKSYQAKKQFGQNFLTDEYYLDKIAHVMQPSEHDDLVEIGPGHGALTQALLSGQPHSLCLIELDRDLIPLLEAQFASDSVRIIAQDALKVDYASLAPKHGQLKIVGNLPYNISTPLLFHLAQYIEHIKEMVFLLQKEVVDRICAKPSCSAYGRLSIMLQIKFDPQAFLEVPPSAFSPPPKVNSSVVRLKPTSRYHLLSEALLSELTARAFSSRRKIIKKTLQSFANDLAPFSSWLSKRPEEISVEDFVKIANLIYTQQKSKKG